MYFISITFGCATSTWVLQDAGLKESLERFYKIPAKNHFVFYFFVNLKKRKWFLLAFGFPYHSRLQ